MADTNRRTKSQRQAEGMRAYERGKQRRAARGSRLANKAEVVAAAEAHEPEEAPKRRRLILPRIQVVSGGLPTLGKRR